ncbi:MAG: ribonuclease P protein component [Cyanobacteria bacterium P01_C01_bin.121]
MALPQHNRLRSNRDFNRVHRKGKRAATQHLAVRALNYHQQVLIGQGAGKSLKASISDGQSHKGVNRRGNRQSADGLLFVPLPSAKSSSKESSFEETTQAIGPRFGISISRKVSKRAVVRNRIKRQLKAIIRDHFTTIEPTWQIVIVVRPPAVECSFADFLRELEYLLQKLAIVKR